jgi:acyl carrier protein
MEAEIKARVRKYIADNIVMTSGAATLADDASLLAHNVLDSTGVIELTTFLEETFAIEVKDEEMVPGNLDTLTNIASFVGRKLGRP